MVAERRAAASLLRGLNRKGLPCIEIPPTQISVLRSPSDFYAQLLARGRGRATPDCAGLAVRWRRRAGRELVGAAKRASADRYPFAARQKPHAARRRSRAARAARAARRRARLALSAAVARQPQLARRAAAAGERGARRAQRKACVFDDTVVLTGANLSAEYFERRQDRYVVIRDAPALADVVCGVLAAVGARNTAYDPDGAAATVEHLGGAERKPLWPAPPADGVGEAQALASAVNAVVRAAADAHPPPAAGAAPPGGCWVLPAVQCAPASLTVDADATEWLLRRNTKLPLALSSPYLNPPSAYERRCSPRRAAAPPSSSRARRRRASGFWGAGGVRSLVPQVYSHLERQLARRAAAIGAALGYAATSGPGGRTTPRGSGSARRRCSAWSAPPTLASARCAATSSSRSRSSPPTRICAPSCRPSSTRCAITPSTPTRTMRRSTRPRSRRTRRRRRFAHSFSHKSGD